MLNKTKKKLRPAPFKFRPFSKKQLQVLTWWRSDSPVKDYDGIICDGSIRAGKTVSMALSYIMWAMESFEDENFGTSGKTIGSHRRNVITPLKKMLKARKYKVKDKRADNLLEISKDGVTNSFYIFGGRDESSQDLIQGITLAGMFFDEVALMPESFVNQATGRCSVEGSKLWFNCNPEGPYHWFKLEWIDGKKEKNMLHIHFTMDDNLSLSDRVKARYKRMYSGIFFKRFILGLWVLAEGVIYDMFNEDVHKVDELPTKFERYYVGIDYGTANPCVFLLIGKANNNYYVIKEYYYDGRHSSKQKTDAEYSRDLKEFLKGITVTSIFIDPSAKSFITQLRQDGFSNITEAKNDVNDGIRTVSSFLSDQKLFIHEACKNLLIEFSSYVWDVKAQAKGEDKPVKAFDHACDALRYCIFTVSKGFNVWTDYIKDMYDKGLEEDQQTQFPNTR